MRRKLLSAACVIMLMLCMTGCGLDTVTQGVDNFVENVENLTRSLRNEPDPPVEAVTAPEYISPVDDTPVREPSVSEPEPEPDPVPDATANSLLWGSQITDLWSVKGTISIVFDGNIKDANPVQDIYGNYFVPTAMNSAITYYVEQQKGDPGEIQHLSSDYVLVAYSNVSTSNYVLRQEPSEYYLLDNLDGTTKVFNHPNNTYLDTGYSFEKIEWTYEDVPTGNLGWQNIAALYRLACLDPLLIQKTEMLPFKRGEDFYVVTGKLHLPELTLQTGVTGADLFQAVWLDGKFTEDTVDTWFDIMYIYDTQTKALTSIFLTLDPISARLLPDINFFTIYLKIEDVNNTLVSIPQDVIDKAMDMRELQEGPKRELDWENFRWDEMTAG